MIEGFVLEEYLPPTPILWLYPLFSVLRFENQRWVRVIAQGTVGNMAAVPAFVNLTATAGTILMLAVLAQLFYFAGWQVTLGTLVLSFAIGMLASFALSLTFKGDSFWVWLLATIGMWPLGYFLQSAVFNVYV